MMPAATVAVLGLPSAARAARPPAAVARPVAALAPPLPAGGPHTPVVVVAAAAVAAAAVLPVATGEKLWQTQRVGIMLRRPTVR